MRSFNPPSTEQHFPLLLLGLCPLLAVTDTAVKAFSIGIATLTVLTLSSLITFMLQSQLSALTRLPVFIIIIAGFSMLVDILMQVHAYPVYKSLGLFVPLIAANPLILAYILAPPTPPSTVDSDSTGISILQYLSSTLTIACWFLLLLVTVGALREILATGAILADLHLVWPVSVEWKLVLIEDYRKYLFILAAPGAFITVGFVLAFRNLLLSRKTENYPTVLPGQEKRVRIHL
jgi:electron transport complex protein RnfE